MALMRQGKGTVVKIQNKEHVFHQPSGSLTSYRQRMLAKLLGRLYEFRKRRCADNQSTQSNDQLSKLETKIHRSPAFDHQETLTQNILKTEADLRKCRYEENLNKLQRWRKQMQDDKHAFKWLRRKSQSMTHAIRLHSEDEASSTIHEALCKLKTYWDQIWDRPRPKLEDLWPEVQIRLPPQSPAESWPPLSVEEVKSAAKACRGTATGLDGWSAEEVCLFSDAMLQTLAQFFLKCEDQGRAPTAWKRTRQVHLSKDKPKQKDGTVLTGDLRPVSIASMMWRICSKARYRRDATQRWILSAMPSSVYGGLRGRGVQDALGVLLAKVHASWFVGTLDHDKAFDRADPALAIKTIGMDTRSAAAALLLDVWGDQTRYLQYMGETLPGGIPVCSSLPQGDCFSMIAMTFVLLPALYDIQEKEPEVRQIIFADDRTFVAPQAEMIQRTTMLWSQWTTKLGLKENSAKAQYFHSIVPGRRSLAETGIHADMISDKIKILGFIFAGKKQRKAHPDEKSRLNEAKNRAARCRCLPGSVKRKLMLAQYSILPKASWGWVFRRPSPHDLRPLEGVCR